MEGVHGVVGSLIGRDGELRLLASAVEQAAQGKTRAAVVLGEAGAGKTAVLNTAAAAAHDARVITVTGNEFSTRPFAVLADVLAATGGLRIERSAQTALEAAVGRSGAASTTDVMTAAVALFGEMAAGGLTLLLVDDLHWLDNASVDVLRYVFNRLEADRLMLLASVRTPERNPLDDLNRLTIIDLAPLDRPSAVTILAQASIGVAAGVADRLYEQSGGNPLALLTAARLLTPEQRRGSSPLPDPIPVGLRLTESFAGEYARLPAATRQALVLLAAGGAADVATLGSALAVRGLSIDDLRAAVVAGFVTDTSPPRFTHPLRRSAAYHGASSGERQAAHAAILSALDDRADPIERAHHLIGAADGPDDDAAQSVYAAAATALTRGAVRESANLFAEAARLSSDEMFRTNAKMTAGMANWLSADFTASAKIAADLTHHAENVELRGLAQFMLGVATAWTDGPASAAATLEYGAASTDDAYLACQETATAGLFRLWAGDFELAQRNTKSAVGNAPPPTDTVGVQAHLIHAIVCSLADGATPHDSTLRQLDDWADSLAPDPTEAMSRPQANPWVSVGYIGMIEMVAEWWDRSGLCLRKLTRFATEARLPALMVDGLVWYGDYCHRVGQPTEGMEALLNVVNEPGAALLPSMAWPRAVLARMEFVAGNNDDAWVHAKFAREFALAKSFRLVIAWAAHAIALGHLGHGDYEAAFEASSETASVMDPSGLRHPGLLWWEADHIEAMIATGRGDAASARIDSLIRRSIECEVRVPRAQALRCTALMSTVDDARRAIAEGLALLDAGESDIPFERARLHLALAERADAAREAVLSRAEAQRAAEIFVRLGANPWLDRCRAITDIEATTTLGALLTEAELRVALVIGAGATNKQAAKQLYLSVKTVEYHLSNIYRKLGIRTRTQLARMTTHKA
ncbi:MAG: AAA family ATPase [Acidimicrobiia bacterium]